MKTIIHWIDTGTAGRLGIMPHPPGGDALADAIDGWARDGVERVVCLLTPGEINELRLAREGTLCTARGIAFTAYPIPDMAVPEEADAIRLAADLAARVAAGESVAIHCWGGIGRSGMLASGVLVQLGLAAQDAMDRVSVARDLPVPETPDQVAWVRRIEAQREG